MTPRCPRCNQFLPLLGVHRCPCDQPPRDLDTVTISAADYAILRKLGPQTDNKGYYRDSPQPTRIGHWATWLVASSLAFTGLLVVAGNAAPRTGPAVVPTQSGAPQYVSGPVESHPADRKVPLGDALTHGASLTPPSLPAATASPQPTSALVSMPVPTPPSTDTDLTVRGTASHMGDSPDAGPGYLALPIGPGHRVRLCGARGCLVVTSNDAGPALFMQRRGRVADLSWELFERLTGLDRSRGLAPISWRELE